MPPSLFHNSFFTTIWRRLRDLDWILIGALVPILAAGLVTMNSFVESTQIFFDRQVMWIAVSAAVFLAMSFVDWRFLRRGGVLVTLFLISVGVLVLLLAVGTATHGAERWFDLGLFSFQPSAPIKIVLILILAKYFARRHVEIADIKHILISGLYAFVLFLLVFLQPDFGTAVILFLIWLGMVLISGISKKHLGMVFLVGVVAFAGLWFQAFDEYQRDRVKTFLYPYTDISGAGYNAQQSTIAVGSGEMMGKGVGYGTQSRLQFLPEYETDFIFAAFAEEWGFVGVVLLFLFYAVVIWRILINASHGATNFEVLYGAGVAILFMSHFMIHVGMNIGLLPITGTTLPFMSYGGTHLLTEFAALGILMGQRAYRRPVHREADQQEVVGV